jgi:hypothetical protein
MEHKELMGQLRLGEQNKMAAENKSEELSLFAVSVRMP